VPDDFVIARGRCALAMECDDEVGVARRSDERYSGQRRICRKDETAEAVEDQRVTSSGS
jgi:hypothetical protein